MNKLATVFVLCSSVGATACDFQFNWHEGERPTSDDAATQVDPDAGVSPSPDSPRADDTALGAWSPIAAAPVARSETFVAVDGPTVVAYGGGEPAFALSLDDGSWRATHGAHALDGVGPISVAMDHDVVAWSTAGGGRYTIAGDFSTPIATEESPGARYGASTVLAGRDMFVWGGANASGSLASGALYDTAADRWLATTTRSAPSARAYATATFMGRDVLVFGGEAAGHVPVGDGALFDTFDAAWTPLQLDGAPSARTHHAAVWTGREVAVWGGFGSDGAALNDGSLFDPTHGTWRKMSTRGAPSARGSVSMAWSGRYILVWGGAAADGHALADGALYDPTADTWRSVATASAPSPRANAAVAWSGHEFVIIGGVDGHTALADGGRLAL